MAIDERELTDAALVEAAQHGDDEAFAELFRRHYPSVRRVCARRLGNAAEGDEVAQAAFVRAYERLDQCVGERRFGAWVQVIAYRLGADLRRLQARAVVTDHLVTGGLGGADVSLGPNHCEEELIRGEEAAAVHEVLATLPPRQREVIVARDLEGRRPGEIAASLGLSLGAVDSLLLRARRRVATAWQSGRPEGGLISAHAASASLAATSAAAGVTDPGSLRVLSRLGDVLARASYHLAGGLGIIDGSQTVAQRFTGVAAVAALGAVPVATVMPPSSLARFATAGVIRSAAPVSTRHSAGSLPGLAATRDLSSVVPLPTGRPPIATVVLPGAAIVTPPTTVPPVLPAAVAGGQGRGGIITPAGTVLTTAGGLGQAAAGVGGAVSSTVAGVASTVAGVASTVSGVVSGVGVPKVPGSGPRTSPLPTTVPPPAVPAVPAVALVPLPVPVPVVGGVTKTVATVGGLAG